MTTASYVYALVRRDAGLQLPEQGVLGAPVRLVPPSGTSLAAVVGTVDADRFGPDALQGGIADLAWLEPVARAHDAVVNAAAGQAVTIPFRLGTTCADDGAVEDLLVDLGPAAVRVLDRLAGRNEWTVHVYAAPKPTTPSPRPPGETGSAFLARRRAELDGSAAGRDRDALDAREVLDAGAAAAADVVRHPVQDARLRTDPRVMVLNAAFLVDAVEQERFLSAVQDVAGRLGPDRVTVSGPWACYSFARLDEPSGEPAHAGAAP